VNAVPIACAVIGIPVGWFSGVLVARVPDRLPLRPLPGLRLDEGKYLGALISVVALFAGVGWRFEDEPVLFIAGYLLLAAMLVTVSIIDVDCFRLPDRIVLPTLAASVVLVVVESLRAGHAQRIGYALAGMAIYFGLLMVFHLISPRGMGFGDVKLAAVMGLYLGWLAAAYLTAFVLVVWALLIGAVLGSVVGVTMLVAQGRSRRTPIPFGPYLAVGALTVVLLTPHLVSLTLNA
jgi:leader peptidase (prepilin peptidase) / N-methyltransferase